MKEREMAIGEFKDVESGEINNLEVLEQPLIISQESKLVDYDDDGSETSGVDNQNGSTWMVFLCTFVAVCGSFEFGSCVSIFICSLRILCL